MRAAYGFGRGDVVGGLAAYGFGTNIIGVLLEGLRVVLSRSSASLTMSRSAVGTLTIALSRASIATALTAAGANLARLTAIAALQRVAQAVITAIRSAGGVSVTQTALEPTNVPEPQASVVTAQSAASVSTQQTAANVTVTQEELI